MDDKFNSDSYEYYLLYHVDSRRFFIALDSELNEDKTIAIERLIANNKLSSSEKELCFIKIWNQLRHEENCNAKLETVFKDLLTSDRVEVVKSWISESLGNFNDGMANGANLMKIIKIIVEVFVSTQAMGAFMEELSEKLSDILYTETLLNAEIVSNLNLITSKNTRIKEQTCQRILHKSHQRTDHLALQNICYFFEEIIQQPFIIDDALLRKYFESSNPTARKQGIYLIKCLIHHKKLSSSDEASFKNFTLISEALQESQHLAQPTLELVKNVNFSTKFSELHFILLTMIIAHDSSLVKAWGLNYILNSKDLVINNQQTIIVLNSLNSTGLYDNGESSIQIECLNQFVRCHFLEVFSNLTEVNWVSVPFYRILESIVLETINQKHLIDTFFIKNLLKQTEMIPMMVKNLVIRSGVQQNYAEITSVVAHHQGMTSLRQILVNIYNMGERHEKLAKLLSCASQKDLKYVISDGYPENFVQFVLALIGFNKGFDDVKVLSINLANRNKLNMMTACQLRDTSYNHLNFLIRETIENILNDVTDGNITRLLENLESLKLGLQVATYVTEDMQKYLVNIFWAIELNVKNGTTSQDIFWDALLLILQFSQNFDNKPVLIDIFNADNKLSLVIAQCQYFILKKQIQQKIDFELNQALQFITTLNNLVDECYFIEEFNTFLKFFKIVAADRLFVSSIFLNNHQRIASMIVIIDKLLNTIVSIDERHTCISDFAATLILLADLNNEWTNHISITIESMMNSLSRNEKAKVLKTFIKSSKTTKTLEQENSLRNYIKILLTEKILVADMMTKEQQIECEISCEIESALTYIEECKFTINDKRRLRMEAAQTLAENFSDLFPAIVETLAEDFAKASRKKPRYFPNTWIHRMKLHCLQSMIFCNSLTSRTVDILIEEVVNINNQLNVTYLIEIILARHHPDILQILKDDKIVLRLKAPALKSIFAIAVMQIRMEDSFRLPSSDNSYDIAEVKLENLSKIILPFTFGQNYGVRSFAQAAVVTSFLHVKSMFNDRESAIMYKIANFCSIITASMKFKNAAKLFDGLIRDFRFTLKFDDIWTIDTFYHHIPSITKMSFEEIIKTDGLGEGIFKKIEDEPFHVAMEIESETYVTADEILIPVACEPSNIINLQQKYLPYKYQIPGQRLMNNLPAIFQNNDTQQMSLKPRSKLVVVASLISRAANLGGLARTCEVFSTENYVVESLKLLENSEFKALSKTAEKWMKISEIKHWQLYEYLLGMKLLGYSIVGAEQSGNSVSLLDAVIPEKCVLLLGDEKEGIPPNLLALLDLTIELPQSGVVRSLNVHVTGAIVIWEYAKQHMFSYRK